MKKYAVIGDPVEHSLSPYIHNPAFSFLSINACYEKIKVSTKELARKISFLKTHYSGWNVTIPHKTHIVKFIDQLSPLSFQAQSVNTVINSKGILIGDSTDGYGLEQAIERNFNYKVEGGQFLFIGAGGATQACVFYLASKKAHTINIINRSLIKAQKIKDRLKSFYPHCKVEVSDIGNDELVYDLCSKVDFIIQATSLGLKLDDPLPIKMKFLSKKHMLIDMIYKETVLQKECKNKGIPILNGLEMLLYQGARSLELWIKEKVPIDSLREELNKAYSSCKD